MTRNLEKLASSWEALTFAEPVAAREARLQAHWAAQLLGAFADASLPPATDDSHASMRWSPAQRQLAVGPTPSGLSVGLRVADLVVEVHEDEPASTPAPRTGRSLSLAGQTMRRALEFLETVREHPKHGDPNARDAGNDPEPPRPLAVREYELPEHPVGQDAPFGPASTPALHELERWFASAAGLLEALAARHPEASPVRCWPHHFDIATLLRLDPPGIDAEHARSIGIGMSPGDAAYSMPYFYVNPWPPPRQVELAELAGGGTWHTTGWFGAVLPATTLLQRAASPAEQVHEVVAFVESALTAERAWLET